MKKTVRHAARSACLGASAAALSAAATAATLPAGHLLAHVELKVNGQSYAITEPANEEQALAMMDAMAPKIATWGSTAWGRDDIGFDQYFIARDESAVHVIVALPKAMGPKLKPGIYPLGGVTRSSMEQSSTEGWSSVCPDKEDPTPTLVIGHFGRPDRDALRMPMLPAGSLEHDFQTHTIHLRQDKASLRLTTVDLPHRWIEGEASGEASWLAPKISLEKTGRGMGPEEACNPSNYDIHTETFELKFAVHFDPRWVP